MPTTTTFTSNGTPVVTGSSGNDLLLGDAQSEILDGLGGNDTIQSGGGDDTLYGGAGVNSLIAGPGDDLLFVQGSADTVDGGTGNDTVVFDFSSTTTGVTFVASLASTTQLDGLGRTHRLFNIESLSLVGGAGADRLMGDAGNDTLAGGSGNDTLSGSGGQDTYLFDAASSPGTDLITDFGAQTGRLFIAGVTISGISRTAAADSLSQGAALLVQVSAQEARLLIGTDAAPGVDMTIRLQGVSVNSGAFLISRDTMGGTIIDFVPAVIKTGTQGNDRLEGGAADDSLDSAGGDDVLIGNDGNDTLVGGDGRDVLLGGSGLDSLSGGEGNDTLRGGPGSDTLAGGAGQNLADYSADGGAAGISADLVFGTVTDSNGDRDRLTDIQDLFGSPLADRIAGDDGANVLVAGAGDDVVDGRGGNDRLDGSTGNDSLDASSGDDVLTGGYGEDSLQGGSGNDRFLAGLDDSGNDVLDGGDGSDVVVYSYAGTSVPVVFTATLSTGRQTDPLGGTDTLLGIERIDIVGGSGADRLTGDANPNLLSGGPGSDTLIGLDGDDRLEGGTGDDSLAAGAGADILVGGSGNDTLDGGASGDGDALDYGPVDPDDQPAIPRRGVEVDLSRGIATDNWGNQDTLRNLLNVSGSNLSDSIIGTDGFNVLRGAEGNDTLVGVGAAGDQLEGGPGDDSLQGGSGRDLVTGGSGRDTMDGGAGQDYLDYSTPDPADRPEAARRGIVVDLGAGTATDNWGDADTLRNIEDVAGSSLDDFITGSADYNELFGLAGNDTLIGNGSAGDRLDGGAGNDSLLGGVGDDWMKGGAGVDTLDGGGGRNQADFNDGGTFSVVVDLAAGTATDTFGNRESLRNFQNVSGSAQDDQLSGSEEANLVYGRGGNDVLQGRGGADTLDSGDGRDTISGGTGDDSISAGNGDDLILAGALDAGNDALDGGSGTDTVRYDFSASTQAVVFQATLLQGMQSDPLGGTDRLLGIERLDIVGSAGADRLSGDTTANTITGGPGDDTLSGGGGGDGFSYDLASTNGTDLISDFGTGANALMFTNGFVTQLLSAANPDSLQKGQATLIYTAGESRLLLGLNTTPGADLTIRLQGGDLSRGVFVLTQSASGSRIDYGPNLVLTGTAGNDNLGGGFGDDSLAGLDGADLLSGQDGRDTLVGGSGQDTLDGGAGDDSLEGGSDDDRLLGGPGADTLVGGTGADIAYYSGLKAAYSITLGAGGSLTVADNVPGRDGVDLLTGVEWVQFADTRYRGPANVAPTAAAAAAVTAEDTALSARLPAATDLDGDSVVYSLEAAPAKGKVTVQSDGRYTYAPTADFNGVDSFSYRISDGQGGSNIYAVTVTVTPVNDAPRWTADARYSIAEDSTLDGRVSTATDSEGDAFTWSKASEPAHGTVSVAADGTFRYVPAPNFFGSDSFGATVTDARGASASTKVSIVVRPVNDAPAAAPVSLTVGEDQSISDKLPTVTDVEGDPVTYLLDTPAAHGKATVLPGGSYSYSPAADYNGPDSFSYAVVDSNGGRNVYTVALKVLAINDAPALVAPLPDQTMVAGQPSVFTLPAGAFVDVDSPTISYSAQLGGNQPLPAWLQFDAGTRTFKGTPPKNNTEVLDIRVNASDGALTGTANFSLLTVVDNFPPVPTIKDDLPGPVLAGVQRVTYTVSFNEPVTGLDLSDFSISGGSISSLTPVPGGVGSAWAVAVTPNVGVNAGRISLSLKAGAVTDSSGNPNPGLTDNAQAVDNVPPVAVSFFPANNAAKVQPDSNITLTFSEPVRLGSGAITLKTTSGKVLETFDASSPAVRILGDTIVLDPIRDLDILSTVELAFGPGAITDVAGNSFSPTQPYRFDTASVDGLYRFFVVAFGAVPGKTYMAQLAEAWNYGLSLKQIVEIFTSKSQFTDRYPLSLSNAELAAKLVENIVGSSAQSAVKAQGVADIKEALDYGLTRGEVVYNVFGNLATRGLTDPVWSALWGDTAVQFQNQVQVARFFTENPASQLAVTYTDNTGTVRQKILDTSTTDLSTLRSVLNKVAVVNDLSTEQMVVEIIGAGAGGGDGGGGG